MTVDAFLSCRVVTQTYEENRILHHITLRILHYIKRSLKLSL